MGYIKDCVQDKMKHNNRAEFLDEKALRNAIWYSSTKESYPQRSIAFDDSWLISPTSDDYVTIAIKDYFDLDEIIFFNGMNDCHNYIDSLSGEKSDIPFLCAYRSDKNSIFSIFVESIRNGLAHGTFNMNGECYFLVNQHRSKIESPFKFLLQTKKPISKSLENIYSFFEYMIKEPTKSKYDCLKNALKLEKRGETWYSNSHDCNILINDDFRFETTHHLTEIKNMMNNLQAEYMNVVIISENLGNISEKNLFSINESTRVISQSKIIEYFQVVGIIQ